MYSKKDPRFEHIYAIPNGGDRDIRVASRLKAEGVKPGVLDVFVSHPSGTLPGMYIEFKAGKNKLTQEQAAFADRQMKAGYPVIIARDSLNAFQAVKKYFDNPGYFEDALAKTLSEVKKDGGEQPRKAKSMVA